MKHEMHVEFVCHWCGKTETLIFLEPVTWTKSGRMCCRRIGDTLTAGACARNVWRCEANG